MTTEILNAIWKARWCFFIAAMILPLIVLSNLVNDIKDSLKREAMVFEDMSEARQFQRECLSKGGSALVREEVTGVTIICTGASE